MPVGSRPETQSSLPTGCNSCLYRRNWFWPRRRTLQPACRSRATPATESSSRSNDRALTRQNQVGRAHQKKSFVVVEDSRTSPISQPERELQTPTLSKNQWARQNCPTV